MPLDVSRALRRVTCSPPARASHRLVARVTARSVGAHILCYHSVNGRPSDRHAILASEFARQMDWLARHAHPVSVERLVDLLVSGAPVPERTVAVTIDDAYLDAYTHAYPVLRSAGIPATVFVPVGLVGCRPAPGVASVPQASFLDWRQMREMVANGVSFGSHGLAHRSLTSLDEATLRGEVIASRERLADELGAPVTGFAYPYGGFRHVSPAIEGLVADAGYRWAVTAISGANRPGCGLYGLRRIVMRAGDRAEDLEGFLSGALDSWALLQRLSAMIPQHG